MNVSEILQGRNGPRKQSESGRGDITTSVTHFNTFQDSRFEKDILCCPGMGYKGLKAALYFIFWKSAYGIVNNMAVVIEIDSRHPTDIVL